MVGISSLFSVNCLNDETPDDQHTKNLAVSEKRKAARARNRQAKQLNNFQAPLPTSQVRSVLYLV